MPKRKKQQKTKDKKLEEPKEEKSPAVNSETTNKTPSNGGLPEKIKQAAQGLSYQSETDAEILPYVGKSSKTIGQEIVLQQTGHAADSPVEEKDFAGFFARLTEIQDWFETEEKATAERFVQLKQVLEQNLRDLKVYRIGKIQIDIYVVGLDADDMLTGIQTKAVET